MSLSLGAGSSLEAGSLADFTYVPGSLALGQAHN